MSKVLIFILTLCTAFFVQVQTQAQAPKNASNAFGLAGTKTFTLQWLGKDKYGKVKITSAGNGRFTMQGKLEVGEDFCSIDGFLIPKSATAFQFVGTIETRVSYLYGGQVCSREATEASPYVFEKKSGRKYFRLQQMQTCDGPNTVDYIDIFEW